MSNRTILNLECASCGGCAPAYEQWHNRDEGYGVCKRCFEEDSSRYGINYTVDTYGTPGIHHSIPLTGAKS